MKSVVKYFALFLALSNVQAGDSSFDVSQVKPEHVLLGVGVGCGAAGVAMWYLSNQRVSSLSERVEKLEKAAIDEHKVGQKVVDALTESLEKLAS